MDWEGDPALAGARILPQDPARSYHARHRVTDNNMLAFKGFEQGAAFRVSKSRTELSQSHGEENSEASALPKSFVSERPPSSCAAYCPRVRYLNECAAFLAAGAKGENLPLPNLRGVGRIPATSLPGFGGAETARPPEESPIKP